VKSLEDLADLAADELVELVPDAGLSSDDAGAIIMDARVRLGWIEAPVEAVEDEAEAEPVEQN
jgi:N utilization substance protein A